MEYFQTGDLLYFKETKKPKGLKEVKNGVLLHSDKTGHAHVLKSGKLFKTKENKMWIEVPRKATLKHEEHKDLALPKGVYRVEQVFEYDHLLEESRAVID